MKSNYSVRYIIKSLTWRHKLYLTLVCLLGVSTGNTQAQDLGSIGHQKPIILHGGLGASASTFNTSADNALQTPFTWNLTGNLTASIYGVSIPLSVLISEQQRSYTQPFNQFGLSPSYKWAKLHLGYRSLTYSPYTLSGITFFGAGVDLNPGKFRFSAMTGRFRKAVEEDTSSTSHVLASYKRTGKAAKVGYGDANNYIDLIYMESADDTASLEKAPVNAVILPEKNTVIGVSGKTTFKKYFSVTADGATSKFSRNLYADEADLERTAVNVTAAYNKSTFGIGAGFKRIEPDFHSHGTAYTDADVLELTAAPWVYWKLLKVKLSTSVGTQSDNLKNDKPTTTKRLISSVAASCQPTPKYGFDIAYSNYGTRQSSGQQTLIDSVRISQNLVNFNMNHRLMFMHAKHIQTFVLTAIYQTTMDQNSYTSKYAENTSRIINLTYVFSPIPVGFGLTLSGMHSETTASQLKTVSNGITAGTSRSFKKGLCTAGSSLSYFMNDYGTSGTGKTIQFNLNAGYRIQPHHQFSFVLNFMNRSGTSAGVQELNELRTTLNYQYTF